jgi:carbonic anhydrase/acetyltransferase-like protein (isoleucine patch superfamily)
MMTGAAVQPIIPETCWIAETAVVRGRVTLGEHVSVWFGAVIRAEEEPVCVGDRTNIQDGAVLHISGGFPCTVGKDVTIGHRAIVHGCTVEDGALIGMGAIVLDGAHIGAGAVVGAGAIVSPGTHIPAGMMALGVPARVVGPVSEARQQVNAEGAASYVARKEAYRSHKY